MVQSSPCSFQTWTHSLLRLIGYPDSYIKERFPMGKTYFLCPLLVLVLVVSSCSSENGQLPVATSTLPADPAPDPEADPEPDPVPEPEPIHPTLIPTNSARIPVTWANLNLTGKLV